MRVVFVVLILLLYAGLCWACWWQHRRRQPPTGRAGDPSADRWLIAYATQGGTALDLARQSAGQLSRAGIHTELLPLNRLSAERLQQQKRLLIIASTYGEGEAPDGGSRFLPRLRPVDLSHLNYGLLALGDRSYRFFCGFGHALDQALHARGAQPLFDLIEVDKGEPAALRHWQYYLGQISGQPLFHDWKSPSYDTWQLLKRQCLNTGSPGAPAYWLQLIPPGREMHWQAGDIAETGPCNSDARIEKFLAQLGRGGDGLLADGTRLREKLRRCDLGNAAMADLMPLSDTELVQMLPELPHREYSIASMPGLGTLDLLVRQVRHGPEDWGLGSGWLTHFAAEGSEILLRVRDNPGFHPPAHSVPLILIGNGTGMAGLRAHLAARSAAGAKNNWLLFGERTQAHDFFFGEDIRAWQAEGFLARLDLVFSRDAKPGAARYVQDLLPPNAELLRSWVNSGAAIYVCGSLQGMAQGVDEALAHILGRPLLDQMAEERRYCRDVY